MAKLENTIITPWQNDNNYAITKSGVEKQDEFTLEDYLDNPSAGSVNLKDTGMQFLSQTYLGKVQNYINDLTGNNDSNESLRPKSTVNSSGDNIGLDFKKIKEEKYKNIKLTSKLGQYNSAMNLLGIASGMYVGTLGQGGTQVLDDAIGMATQSLPIAGLTTNAATTVSKIIQTAKSSSNAIPTIVPTDSIVDLAVANYYTILTSKPGLKIKAYGNKLEYVTGENNNSIFLTNEELEEYKNKFKFFAKEKGENNKEYYTTGVELLKKEGILKIKDAPNNSLDTVINSSIRKEVKIRKDTEELTEYELLENTKDFNDFFEGSYSYFDNGDKGRNFPRVTKARIFNRVNNIYRNIGGLYVEPFMASDASGIKCFEIPFEFNPTITEGAQSAKYNTTEVLGRILSLRSYVSSDASTVSLEADYLALAEEFEEDSNADESKNLSIEGRKHLNMKNSWISGWMSDWTTKRLSIIERQFRSLTLPYINKSEFVRPPIVRIKMRSSNLKATSDDTEITDTTNLKVGDLFRYPSLGDEEGSLRTKKIQITHLYENQTRDKRYVVTSVSITPLSQYGNSYFYNTNGISSLASNASFFNSMKRNGFKVKIDLVETTKNFLDLIPNYGDYIREEEQEDLEYFNSGADYLSAIKDNIDLWSCLNAPLKMDLTHVYSNAQLFPCNEDSGFIENKKKKESESELENDLLDPEKNFYKSFEDYKKELEKEGCTAKDIAIMLFNSEWWGINGKEDSENRIEKLNKAFKKWLFETCYNDFNKNWEEYYSLLKKLNITDKEIYENVKGEWKQTDKYVDEFLSKKLKLSFEEYLKALKESFGDKKDKIITNLKHSKYNDMPVSEINTVDRNEFQNFMAKESDTLFSSFDELVENSGLTKDEVILLVSGAENNKDEDYYKWEQEEGFYKRLTSDTELLQKYLSRNSLTYLKEILTQKYPNILSEGTPNDYKSNKDKRTKICYDVLKYFVDLKKGVLNKDSIKELSNFVDELAADELYNFKFDSSEINSKKVDINDTRKEELINVSEIGRGKEFEIEVNINKIREGSKDKENICISKFVPNSNVNCKYEYSGKIISDNFGEYKITNLADDKLPWVIRKEELTQEQKNEGVVKFKIITEKEIVPKFKIINGFVNDEHLDYFTNNSAIKEIKITNLTEKTDDNGCINIYNAVKKVIEYGSTESAGKQYLAYLMEDGWIGKEGYDVFSEQIPVGKNEAQNYGFDGKYEIDNFKYFESNDEDEEVIERKEFYNDKEYSPDDSDIQYLIDDESFGLNNYNAQMFLVFFNNGTEENKFKVYEDNNKESIEVISENMNENKENTANENKNENKENMAKEKINE